LSGITETKSDLGSVSQSDKFEQAVRELHTDDPERRVKPEVIRVWTGAVCAIVR